MINPDTTWRPASEIDKTGKRPWVVVIMMEPAVVARVLFNPIRAAPRLIMTVRPAQLDPSCRRQK
jgi:hypothetical protein